MRKTVAALIMLFVCLTAYGALSEDIELGKHSLINLDYGPKTGYKESYYIAYIKNTCDEPLLIESIGIDLFDETGIKITSDKYPFQIGADYLEPGETTCVCFLTYFGETNHERNAASVELHYTVRKDDISEFQLDRLDSSNSVTEGGYDAATNCLHASITNRNTRNLIDAIVTMVLEDTNGNPVFMTVNTLFNSILDPGNTIAIEYRFGDYLSYDKKLKEYYSENGITPANVKVYVKYGFNEANLWDGWEYAI